MPNDAPPVPLKDLVSTGGHARADTVIAWAAVILSAAFCFWTVLFPLSSTDIWWHLAAGRRMVQTHAFLHEDPFAYAP